MRQYLEIKDQNPDAILFFRLGDFYEMFFEDAVYVSRVLGLTLTSRDKGREPGDAIPMCGVPHHSVRTYLARLTELGHRVALCEQLEDPRAVKGLVRRGVVRIVTPGVMLDEENLDPRAPNCVAAVAGGGREGFGLASVDVTTGDFRATHVASRDALADEVARLDVRELVLAEEDGELADVLRRACPRLPLSRQRASAADARSPADELAALVTDPTRRTLLDRAPEVRTAAVRLLRYVRATQLAAPLPIHRLELYEREEHLVLDEQARAHLELTETMQGGRRDGALLAVLDRTASAMGGRLLRRWLLFPLRELGKIRRRHDAVAALVEAQAARDDVRARLAGLADLERLTTRARLGVATPRDLLALGRGLAALPEVAARLGELRAGLAGEVPELLRLPADLEQALSRRLLETLSEDAGASTKDGGFIRPGVSAELDELRALAAGGRDGVAAIEARERARTGIPSLKVKFNNVFGYYIEVTRAHLRAVPADYVRKQTVANAERFVTAELSEYEEKIRTAEERRIGVEQRLFAELREAVAERCAALLELASRVATVDVLAALAEVAHRQGFVRPELDDGGLIELLASRHPVVETLCPPGGFVPNDVRLDREAEQLLLVTGPNMAGKSTLIRQVALAVIMAQMGSFVAARAARIGLCDRVFTRVGAGDDLARGESTFLVEMRETAHILRHASRASLVILDEIGRGTSTYDGVSIAWAVAEHLHDVVGARALFATHYHELCALPGSHPRVRNVSVAAHERDGQVVFLRKLQPGGASRSFGIEVARLAGLPGPVLDRARAILASLESGAASRGAPARVQPEAGSPQLGLFATSATGAHREEGPGPPLPDWPGLDRAQLGELVRRLRGLVLDDTTPRQAWDLLAELRRLAEGERS